MLFHYNCYRCFDYFNIDFLCDISLSDDVRNILGVNKCGENKIIITYPHNVQVLEVSEVVPHYSVTKEWSTKLKLSSAVTHDANTDTFVGVFHDLFIRIWTIDVDSFDNADKFTFQNQILKILPREDSTSLVIFKNGYCTSLLHALENSKLIKARSLIRDSSSIVESSYYTRNKTDYVCYVVKDKSNQYSVLTCPVREEVADCDRVENEVLRKVIQGPTVTGHQIDCGSKKHPFVYFTWNDSTITQFDLQKRSWKVYRAKNLSPMINEEITAMTSIEKNYFMLYGRFYGETDVISALNIVTPNGTLGTLHQEPRAKSHRIFCPLKRFAVTANDSKMSLWRTCLIKVDHKRKPTIEEALQKICNVGYNPLAFPPILGWSKNKVWRRSNLNRFWHYSWISVKLPAAHPFRR